jgi:hypothetical protein
MRHLLSWLHQSCRVVSGRNGETKVVKVRSSQKLFTDFEVSSLTGIGLEDLRELARSRHLGFLSRAAEAAEQQAASLLFTLSDLMVLTVLYPRFHS